jgi:hypothetical protein
MGNLLDKKVPGCPSRRRPFVVGVTAHHEEEPCGTC